jgi:hypothetical protein
VPERPQISAGAATDHPADLDSGRDISARRFLLAVVTRFPIGLQHGL